MHINQLKDSKFLKKEDCGNGILVTVAGVDQENVAKSGAPEELKWCLRFTEDILPMVLNNTNAQIIAKIANNEDTDGWPGTKLVLYNDPNVSFSGRVTGGIRVRAPRNQAVKPATQQPTRGPMGKVQNVAPAPEPEPEVVNPADDDVPF